MLQRLRTKVQEKLHRFKKWEPLIFFVGGFSFDALLLHRIDDPLMLVHQATYLTVAALIIAWDLFCEAGKGAVHKYLEKVWTYREGILHFLLGTLLNVYTIFYFKSGSFTSALSFLIFLSLLKFLNEARPSRISKNLLRNALFALCLISYMNIVVSILVGSVGLWVFLLAICAAALVHALFLRLLKSRLTDFNLRREIQMPFYGIAAIYILLYVLKVLPPVPLSVKYMGIYREITKTNATYQLGYTRSKWRFWEHGDQTFYAHPGDKIFCFAQIFSPARFKDQLFVRWEYKDAKLGWKSQDAIPLGVVGGREEGYRGYTVKTNYQPGDWRVSIETKDGREIGELRIEVKEADLNEPTPTMNYDLR